MEGNEWTKVKYTHSGPTLRKTPLNINSIINNEKQNCKIGTVCVVGTRRREEGE
jgi:hypothetical protein